MDTEEYQSKIRELAFRYLAAPVVILISMSTIGKIADSLLGLNNILSIVFTISGLVIYIIPMVFRKTLTEEFVEGVKNTMDKKI